MLSTDSIYEHGLLRFWLLTLHGCACNPFRYFRQMLHTLMLADHKPAAGKRLEQRQQLLQQLSAAGGEEAVRLLKQV